MGTQQTFVEWINLGSLGHSTVCSSYHSHKYWHGHVVLPWDDVLCPPKTHVPNIKQRDRHTQTQRPETQDNSWHSLRTYRTQPCLQWLYVWARFILTITSSGKYCFYSYFTMKKLRGREVKWLGQCHTASKWQSQDLNTGSLAGESSQTCEYTESHQTPFDKKASHENQPPFNDLWNVYWAPTIHAKLFVEHRDLQWTKQSWSCPPWSLYSGVGGHWGARRGGQGQDTALGSTLLKKMKAQSESCENQERGGGRCSGDKG